MLHLTPAMLEATYELLRLTPPFKRWKLPEPDALGFKITNQADRYGHYNDGKPQKHWPHIAISARNVKDLPTLIRVIAHEMCHMRQGQLGKTVADHGRAFKRLAKEVCKYHSFDLKDF